MESTFIEMINPKKSNIIVSTIYKHPSVDLTDFNSKSYSNSNLLEKVSKEQKSVFLLGDFNINLLNYNVHNPTNEFLDSLTSNFFFTLHLAATSHSKAIIDNIFTNVTLPDSTSGTLTATISDHLPQFLIVSNILSNPPSNKSNLCERLV